MENLVVKVERVNNILVTTSNRVAEELGVEHKNLLTKIDDYFNKFSSAELSAQFYIPNNYKAANGRTVRNYLITEKGIAQLIGGYSAAVPRAFELNVAYINEFERMKQELAKLKLPTTYLEALKELVTKEEALITANNLIQEQKPKVLFANAVSASKTSILIGDLAKLLKQNGIETGQKRLFSWLRDNGYLIKRKGADYNMPTQKSMELELFEIKETTITHSDGHITVNKTTKVTGKGQMYFINKFLKDVA